MSSPRPPAEPVNVETAAPPVGPAGVLGDEAARTQAPCDRAQLVAAFKKLLDEADPRAIRDAYVAARLEELARPTPPLSPAVRLWRRVSASAATAVPCCAGVLFMSVVATAVLGLAWWLTPAPAYAHALWGALVLTGFAIFALVTTVDYSATVALDAPPPSPTPLDPSAQLKVVLTEATALHADLTAAVQAKNAYGFELIKHATTRQRYELERATEEAKTADQRARKAQFERQAEPLHPMAAGVLTLQAEVRERVRARIESEKPENRRAAEAAAAEHRRAQERAEAEHQVALAALAAQRAEYEERARTADEDSDEPVDEAPTVTPEQKRAEELAAAQHAAALDDIEQQRALNRELTAGRIRGLNDPAASGSRRTQRRRLEQQQQRLQLAQLDAEVVSHRTRAKLLRERPLSPEEQFALRAKDRMRSTLNKARVIAQTERDGQAHLRRVARDHGDDSEQYHEAEAMLDALLMDLRGEAEDSPADNLPSISSKGA